MIWPWNSSKEQAGNNFPDFPRIEDLWDSRPRLFFIRTAEGGCPTTVGLESGSYSQPVPKFAADQRFRDARMSASRAAAHARPVRIGEPDEVTGAHRVRLPSLQTMRRDSSGRAPESLGKCHGGSQIVRSRMSPTARCSRRSKVLS